MVNSNTLGDAIEFNRSPQSLSIISHKGKIHIPAGFVWHGMHGMVLKHDAVQSEDTITRDHQQRMSGHSEEQLPFPCVEEKS